MTEQPTPHAQDQAITKAIVAREAAGIPQQLRARAFNAVGPALQARGEWLRLTARQTVADAVLAAIKPELDAYLRYENTITWMTTCTSCATVLDNAARDFERADRAEAAIDRARAIPDHPLAQPAPPDDEQVGYVKGWMAASAAYLTALDGEQPTPAPEATEATDGPRCSCGGRFPLAHVHADQHQPEDQP